MIKALPLLSFLNPFGLLWAKRLMDVIPSLPEHALKNPILSFQAPRLQLMITSLVINLLSLSLPILTLQVYDRLLVSQNWGTLQVLVGGVIVVIILDTALRLCRSYITAWAGAVYEHALACNSMRHILASDLVFLQRKGVGTYVQRMAGIEKLREFMSGSALVTLIDLPFVLVFLGLIIWLAGWLVLVPLVLLGVFTVFSIWLGKRLKTALEILEDTDRKRLEFIIESLEGIHSLKSMALELFFERRYEYVQKKNSAANLDLGRLSAEAIMVGTLFSQIMMVAVIGYGTPMVLNGSITMGTLIACLMLSARVTQPVRRALGLWTRYQDFILAHEEVKKTFDIPVLKRIDPGELSDNGGCLEIRNMSFAYNTEHEPILHNINLVLQRGESMSISGPRGCGKTAMLKLMAGLYRPERGEIYIDGTPATKYIARELVQHVGFLPMEGIIFRGTIWENLSSFGEYEAEKVHEIAELLDLEKAVKQLPAGFDTKLEGSQSDPLPPGLRQRLAIARALVPKPRIILFDNADRALDRDGYNTVYRLLARLKKRATLILVSDDQNITRLAEKDYMISAGTLISKKNTIEDIGDISPYRELRL